MNTDKQAGIVYSATRRQQYLAEAFLSAHSVKDLTPEIPITLYTDMLHLPYARADCFDEVIPIETTSRLRSQWAEGQLDRIKSLLTSPYPKTLHLDTDTRVYTPDIRKLFDKLDRIDIAMAICQPDASICSRESGLSMFNVGVILFRQSEKVIQLLNAWHDLTARNFALANQDPVPEVECLAHITDSEQRRKLLFMDQTSMVQLLSPETNKFGVELEILGEAWNFRGASAERKFQEPIMISHHPGLRPMLGNDVIQRAKTYLRDGKVTIAREILQNMLDHFPFAPEGKARLAALIRSVDHAGQQTDG
ncbi:MAG: hypothetical protein AB1560_01385 [Pseudomonadota bacterium]